MGTIILFTKKYLKLKYVSIIFIITIPLLVFYPSYNDERLANAVFLKNPDFAIENYEESIEKQSVLFYQESIYQNVRVTSFDSSENTVLRLDGKIQCSTSDESIRGLVNMASLPFNLYTMNYGNPQTALNVGLGCGTTSSALSQNLQTTTIEIDPAVVEANEFFYDLIDHRLIIDDARNWLLKTDEKFDMIITEPSEPWMNWSLYTKEYFEILSNSVTENGVVAQWIPVYELKDDEVMVMYNTFHSVFPYVYVYLMEPEKTTQLIFIGSQHELKIKENPLYLFDQDDIMDVKTELNTDNKPIIEFATANSLYGGINQPVNIKLNDEELYKKLIFD